MELKILIVKNNYKKKLNLKKGLDWFTDNTPLKITVEEIETNFDFTFKEVGNGTFKGGVISNYYDKLKTVVPDNKYDIVCIVYGNDCPYVRVSISENIPLYKNTDVIQVVKVTDGGKTFNHELIHTIFKKLARKGINLNDPMDTYLNDGSLTAKVSNRTMALELLKPYWDTLLDNKPTDTMNYKYFKPNEIIGLKPELVQVLDKAREIAGVPFKITSGYRTPEKNASIGGVQNSSHTKGLAVDLYCTDNFKRTKILTALYTVGTQLFIEICKSHIHVDIDSSIHSMGQTMWANDD